MIKKNLPTLIITSIVTLTPIATGILLWDKLPDTIATHFGANNEPNGFMSKPMTVFFMPLVLLVLHWLCALGTAKDPKMKNVTGKMLTLCLWIVPLTSVLMSAVTYSYALGGKIKVGFTVLAFLGVLFTVIGNYLPKCKPSYTIGIKLPWTLKDSEVWERTHRLAGKLWVVCGTIIALTSFMESPVIAGSLLAIMVVVPFIYSCAYYNKKKVKP